MTGRKHRFKKSGEFDRLRRELLAQFQSGVRAVRPKLFAAVCVDWVGVIKSGQVGTEAFCTRVDDIARARLEAEDKLHLKADDTLHRELLQELDRFPLVERALADVPALADPEFAAGIRRHAENLVRRSRGLSEEEPSRVNGARDVQPQRNGASHDEAPRDEGMEISDG